MVLFDRQVARLDGIINDIRAKTNRSVSRATIIRALIEGLLDSRLDLTSVGGESEVAATIARLLSIKSRDGDRI